MPSGRMRSILARQRESRPLRHPVNRTFPSPGSNPSRRRLTKPRCWLDSSPSGDARRFHFWWSFRDKCPRAPRRRFYTSGRQERAHTSDSRGLVAASTMAARRRPTNPSFPAWPADGCRLPASARRAPGVERASFENENDLTEESRVSLQTRRPVGAVTQSAPLAPTYLATRKPWSELKFRIQTPTICAAAP